MQKRLNNSGEVQVLLAVAEVRLTQFNNSSSRGNLLYQPILSMHSSAIFIASFQDGTARRHYGNRRKIHKLPRPFPDWMEERCEAARVDTAPKVVEHEIEVRAPRHHLQADILGAVRITPALEGVWVDEPTK